ncbi:MAG: formylglycine-generating enzyme family protein, partial [bacterium]|nr:formylglycine-generating enzyme family protein [bacterium]
ILLGESAEVYRFPHRSFQEYLAACHLTRDVAFPELLKAEVEAQPELWREVVLLSAGRSAERPVMVWGLIGALVRGQPPADADIRDPRFLFALYASLAVAELGLWRPASEQEEKLGQIRGWLTASLRLGALAPKDRAEGGRVLARLDDPREGVGLDADGVPEIDWVKIPAGSFLMGSDEPKYGEYIHDDEKPQHEVSLPPFRISRYPVTNAQYHAFVKDGGYTKWWRECWTQAGWKWKAGREGPRDDLSEVFLLANHPRIGVTWYEAHAFSRWLGARLGHEVSVPTEAQWERAARGTDGRVYPWEGKFDPSR